MKYLKLYRIFEAFDPKENEILETLDDIYLELEDSGHEVMVTQKTDGPESNWILHMQSDDDLGFYVEINKPRLAPALDRFPDQELSYSNISEVIERSIDYMKSEGYECKISCGPTEIKIDKLKSSFKKSSIFSLNIKFYKI